jgi:HD-GYP domain-containing protein (c-di-GMP phosphodiesterase class II)
MPLRMAQLQAVRPPLTTTGQLGAAAAQETPFAFFMAIMAAVEAREPTSTGRARLIALHAVATARALLLPNEVVDTIRLAALLANLGMINVPETILHKGDTLHDEERATIRQHPVLGSEMLATVPQLRGILPLILHHHEDWRGGGYPHGLRGEAIPLGARIIRVCETYDALTSVRPYRGAFGPQEALALLANGAGKEFDPRIVEAFTARLRRNLAIHDELLDHWDDLQQQARVWKIVANVASA